VSDDSPTRKPLLILEVDETLVFASERPLEGRMPDFRVGTFSVYRRPHLTAFLEAVSGPFELAVWSSASLAYVSGVTAALFPDASPLKFICASDRCTARYHPERQERFYLKNLKKVRRMGYRLEQVLMIDDSPEKLSQHYGNHIRVRPFTGDPADDELLRVAPFVVQLATVDNVRLLEKRHWRQAAAAGEAG
jgi:TFIIF-interacting CTD phosphatase-like protein